MNKITNLKTKANALPDTSGVYLMKDLFGKVIYVGKANSLKKRLSSYFGGGLSPKTAALMQHAVNIEYELCPTESLALLREANLIHKYMPKYNVVLRDDKSFPYVVITNEEYPAVHITREKENDGSVYLGPYTSAKLLTEALRIIRRSFPYRSCKKLPKKACVYYRLNLSPAPCIGKISRKDYAALIKNIRLILEGKTEYLTRRLSRMMRKKSKEHQYEEAAKIRDQIKAISAIDSAQAGPASLDELQGLKELLNMERLPERIEAFDISNISGQDACGSMVSFYKGVPDKNNYRRFRIKTVEGIDDYKMLSEVVRRRYQRLLKEKLPLPDLILIDGGLAHLSTAQKELEALGLNLALVSIAKEEENIYTKGSATPFKFKSDNEALNLIRRVRDEAHRFAISYHHLLRRKRVIGK
ncbi:MAG: excinuclease ABC subunit UvrC [Candidatus Omnitrophota bacterium]|jgi:excinuclease ABC subunit C